MVMATQITPTPVIGKDEEHIGWRLIRRSLRSKPKNEQRNECYYSIHKTSTPTGY
jgi:hypothetical protein